MANGQPRKDVKTVQNLGKDARRRGPIRTDAVGQMAWRKLGKEKAKTKRSKNKSTSLEKRLDKVPL
jgi:hypothetical protein